MAVKKKKCGFYRQNMYATLFVFKAGYVPFHSSLKKSRRARLIPNALIGLKPDLF
jgi:hypothetical protein